MSDRVLILGGGGREHVLAWKLAQSARVSQVVISPGNAGTHDGNGKIVNGSGVPGNHEKLAEWCVENKISLVVVGPEAPLAAGVADTLKDGGVACFGPSKKAAEIESSKEFAKEFMDRNNIPTAKWKSFTDKQAACDHINSAPYKAQVVKASGLAAGKGVIVAHSREQACQAVQAIMGDKQFGEAGDTVVIEELLEGEEVSVLAFCDGQRFGAMPPAQDHKRLLEEDLGPNTGGMGAYCPCPQVDKETLEKINAKILEPAVSGMLREGRPYVGVLYAGLMLTPEGPKVLEFNCRFGDPEAQVVLPLLKSDLYQTMLACATGQLHQMPSWQENQFAVAVVMASGGYPASYKKGMKITGLDRLNEQLVFHAGTASKDGAIVSSGGRVLAVVAMAADLPSACSSALEGANIVKFEDAFYRKDIGWKGCSFAKKQRLGLSYSQCGVDIAAGNSLVERIKPLAALTARSGCDASLGGFGGIFDPKAAGYKDPLLVSGTDGVGTKLKVAQACGIHQTVGVDLVAMCVNDILAHGAESLFFLDYFACGRLDVDEAEAVVRGVTEGCRLAGCALLGGETAEMPGMYGRGEYDLAGFAVGAVERGQTLPRKDAMVPGDLIIGVASSGVHSNGFSLVRKVVEKSGLGYNSPCPFADNKTLGEALLEPTKIYSQTLLPAVRSGRVKGYAHITGGGLLENIPRVLPAQLGVELDAARWQMPPVFGWLARLGAIGQREMARTFNCGVGAVLVTEARDGGRVMDLLRSSGETAWIIGSTVKTDQDGERVVISNLGQSLDKAAASVTFGKIQSPPVNPELKLTNGGNFKKLRVGVLISGTGTNLQALIDHTKNREINSCAEIAFVLSNKANVQGLERAKQAGIPTEVISHKDFKSRVEFDMKLHEALLGQGIEFVCLAGFMRILSGEFVRRWTGKLINIHPSLLPSFRGIDAHKQVLQAGVRLSGCTVHYVVEEVDAGSILVQESVPVLPGDTEETLQERVKGAEHRAYPRAMELVASGRAAMGEDGKVNWDL